MGLGLFPVFIDNSDRALKHEHEFVLHAVPVIESRSATSPLWASSLLLATAMIATLMANETAEQTDDAMMISSRLDRTFAFPSMITRRNPNDGGKRPL